MAWRAALQLGKAARARWPGGRVVGLLPAWYHNAEPANVRCFHLQQPCVHLCHGHPARSPASPCTPGRPEASLTQPSGASWSTPPRRSGGKVRGCCRCCAPGVTWYACRPAHLHTYADAHPTGMTPGAARAVCGLVCMYHPAASPHLSWWRRCMHARQQGTCVWSPAVAR